MKLNSLKPIKGSVKNKKRELVEDMVQEQVNLLVEVIKVLVKDLALKEDPGLKVVRCHCQEDSEKRVYKYFLRVSIK